MPAAYAVLSGLQFALLIWTFLETPLPRWLDQAGARTPLKLRDTMRGEVSDRMQLLCVQEGWLARDLNLLA